MKLSTLPQGGQCLNIGVNMNEVNELFVITMEECAEVSQACSKMIRFGEESNRQELEKEVGDLLAMVDLLEKYGIINIDACEKRMQTKFEKLKIYSSLKV